MKFKEIKALCEDRFATHTATLIQNTDRFCIIDWRRSDDSYSYYINYIVDKENGSFIVNGNLGNSVATWFGKLSVTDLKNYIHKNTDYYIDHIRCSTDLYDYSVDDVVKDIKSHLNKSDVKFYVDNSNVFKTEDDLWKAVKEEVACSIYVSATTTTLFSPSEILWHIIGGIIGEVDHNTWEWLSSCGRSVTSRVYLWAEGFCMACKQLGI